LGLSDALMVGKNRQQIWEQRTRKYQGQVHLFIYKVRHSHDAYAWTGETRFCTVFALGSRFQDAEHIAINCVHQHGWRILKTDTATPFDVDKFGDNARDQEHLASLVEYGASFYLEPEAA
jgi:hypothetical protein